MSEGGTITVLHVDDDTSFLDLASTFLKRDFPKFDVTSVESPNEALDLLDDVDVDCVVSDHDMPETTGLDLLKTVRRRHPQIPFILFTGKGSEEIAAEAVQAGVDAYLQKGGTEKFDLLGTQVRNVVTSSRLERERAERTKELSVLHHATLVLLEERELDEKLHDFVYTLPSGWRFPEHTAARLSVPSGTYATPNFAETEWEQTTSFDTPNGTTGTITVSYVGEWEETGSPFIDEEAELLTSLGNLLSVHLERTDLIGKLERTNEELSVILDNLPALVYMKDVEGRYLLVNDAFEERSGRSEEEIIGRTPAEVFDSEWGDLIVEHDRIALERGEPVEFEESVERDGSVITYLSVRIPLLDDDGDPYAIYGISTDISEQANLIEEQERIMNRMTDAFYALDSDWEFTYLNESAERVLQRDEADLLGTRIWEEFPGTANSELQEQYERAMEVQETVEFDYYDDPVDVLFELRVYPSPTGLSVYFRDVTEDREAERELEQYRTMVETVGDPMYVLDENGILTKANTALLQYLDRTREEIVGTHASKFIVKEDAHQATELIGSLLSGDEGNRWESFEMRVLTADGTVRTTETKFGLLLEDGEYRGAVGVVRDIADRKAYEEQLEDQNQRLEKFASVVSHDLRNPLAVAEGYVDIAREERDSDALDNVAAAHTRMRQLIDDLLLLAREGKAITDLTPVDLGTLVEECWENVDTRDATLVVDTGRVVLADESRLRQLVENLVRNAVEHGGDDATITVGDVEDGFVVEDDGPGIPPDERDRIWDLGYSTRRDGTGFGLGIVMEIAEAHGWDVRVTEGSSGGARFEVSGVADGERDARA